MGYMQEIIRRGNVKYFISQKQEEQNKPIENLDDIGEGSAWYVQDDRPRYEQGMLYNRARPAASAGTSNYNFYHIYTSEGQSLRDALNLTANYTSNSYIDPYYSNINSSGGLFWIFILLALYRANNNNLDPSFYYTSSKGYNYCKYQNGLFNERFSIQIEPYNLNYSYIDMLDRRTGAQHFSNTKNARFGIRADLVNNKIVYGINGKIYLPQYASFYFCGSSLPILDSLDNTIRKIPQMRYFGVWDLIDFFSQIFDDSKTHDIAGIFADNIISLKQKITLRNWKFSNAKNFAKMFALAKQGSHDLNDFDLQGNTQILKQLDISILDTSSAQCTKNMFYMYFTHQEVNSIYNNYMVQRIYVGEKFILDNVTLSNSAGMFYYVNITNYNIVTRLKGGAGTVWSSSNPTDKTYAHWDEGQSNPGYFWNPNVMDPLVLVPGPQFNQAFMAAVNTAAGMADSDRAPAVQTLTGTFNFIAESNKPNNLFTLSNNDVKQSGDGVAYIGYTYSIADRSFAVYLVSDNIGQNNIKANPNCADMFAMDNTIPGSLSLNIQWLNTSQVTNMENMFGYKGV